MREQIHTGKLVFNNLSIPRDRSLHDNIYMKQRE